MPREECQAVTSFADHRNIVIKKADKGSCVVISDRNDYLVEAEKQLRDTKIYRDVSNTENIPSRYQKQEIKGLKRKQMEYFTYEFKKANNFGKLYLPPKVHKRLHNVPGRPPISNCGSPTENCSEFIDHYFKPIIHKQNQKP